MQLQQTPQYNPQFTARNISRVITNTRNGVKSVIDVYKVDQNDASFLKRFTEALKGQTLPEDTLMIGGKEVKASVTDSLNHITAKDKRYNDGLLIAIENKKNIAGILDYRENGDMDIHTLYMFKDNSVHAGRKALLIQALKNIKKEIEFYAQIKTGRISEKAEKYYRNLGFGKERGGHELLIPDTKLQEKIEKLQSSPSITVKDFRAPKNVDLTDILKLDD